MVYLALIRYLIKSLSLRRAWIEILAPRLADMSAAVALLAESVDRNYKERPGQKARPKSLSLRRAWIEMCFGSYSQCPHWVALLAESVDRNLTMLGGSGVGSWVALLAESVDRNSKS